LGAYFGYHFGKANGKIEGRELAEKIAAIKGQ
jgi:hypothetical protein